jgi:hypothetical protein
MSFLIEQAGGLALTGKNRVMDVPPTSVHQRVPCIRKYIFLMIQHAVGLAFVILCAHLNLYFCPSWKSG